jgi:hypothetical protein
MNCPVCGSRATGQVEQFYCWDCCVEYKKQNNEISVFELAEDGSLMACGINEEV